MRRQFVRRRIILQCGIPSRRGTGQLADKLSRQPALRDWLATVEVPASSAGTGIRTQQQAAPGAQRGCSGGGDFCAVAAVSQTGIVDLLPEVPELQQARVFGGAEFYTALRRGIVEHKLIVAALPGTACRQLLGLDAGEARAMAMRHRSLTSEPGGCAGAGLHGSACKQVARRVTLPLAVMECANHHRAVDVAMHEGHDHLLAGPWHEDAAPVGTGNRTHDPYPGAQRIGRRRVVGAAGVRHAAGTVAAALPGKLHPHPMVAVGMGWRPWSDHHRGQRTADIRTRMDPPTVAVPEQRPPR